ncbi:uncharacterized protein [Haliotis cracherodii]|uniref:uncharacterized protein n=1 Tax=Haliotis cracherodii TaxID=6455 RepID=UPI0039E833AF
MLSIVHIVQSQGYPPLQDTKYARDGGNITLSWKLHTVFLNEFTVRGPSMFNSIFHVVNFSQPTLVNETYRSRVHDVAVMRESERMFSFLLTDIGMSDGGTYSVFTGSPNTDGIEVQSCRLVVTHVVDPYIVATDTAQYRRTLTCYSFTVMSGEGSLTTSHSWRKNNLPVESGRKYNITSYDGRSYNWEYYHVSTLAVRDVRESEMRDRYSCQATVDKLIVTVLSEEKTLLMTPALTDFPNTTVMKETDNVNITWNIPRHDYDFYVYHHSGDLLLHVNETMIYTMDKYWSRIKISDVSTTSHSLSVQFTLYNVTSSDAGKLDCRVYHKEWHILPDWHHMLILARKPEDPHIYSSGSVVAGKPLMLMCSTLSKSLPVDHGQRMSYTWRRNSLLLESTNKYHHTGSALIIGAFHDEWHYRGRYSCQANDLNVSNWSAEFTVEETYTETTVIFVILGSCVAVLVIVTVTVATFCHAYNVVKDSFHPTSVDNYITPVADTGISVDDVEVNTYEMIDVGSHVDQITPIPNQSDVGSSDQMEPSSDDGGQGDSLDGTRQVHIVDGLELNELDVTSRQSTVFDDPSMSQSHVYYTTPVKDRRPQTDAAGYLPWNEAKRLLTREENDGPKYAHICDVMDLNEPDFTPGSITVIRDPLTPQAHTYYNASEQTKRPQTDAAGYLPWNEAKGMLFCEENNATEHHNNIVEAFYSDGSNVKQTNLNFENDFNE